MKSRHMSVMHPVIPRRLWRLLPWLGALLLLLSAGAAAFAQETADPPARVGVVTYRQGSVVFAPQGEDEWIELPQNRPITAGDRIWTDAGARAELQMGTASLHVDGKTHLGVSDLDERAAQFILQQGSVNARVRDLAAGENFEIGTPNLAFRALQPGDYRIDVNTATGETRVTVQSGTAQLFGDRGAQSVTMGAGQQATFAGRALAQVRTESFALDDFSLWAAERNRVEDQSIAARHVPRGVVGYPQLDGYGQWAEDPTYGPVWYPQLPAADWAPYRFGHWDWISPWGWTWIDDAPWGFAPFHYGRWTVIGDRWAWVPGPMALRPVYAPALVVFLGGLETGYAIDASPAVGWYPLAPGEAFYPVFRSSPRYLGFVNFNINLASHPRNRHDHFWRNHTRGITAMPQDDFRRGRPVGHHWQRLQPRTLGVAQVGVVPARPDRDRTRRVDAQQSPRLGGQPPFDGGRFNGQPRVGNREQQGAGAVPQQQARPFFGNGQAPAVREQFRAQHEQQRLQREAERAAREQQRQQAGAAPQDALRAEREQMLRQQQERAARIGAQRQQEGAQREALVRQMQERAQQREAWQRQREQARAAHQHTEPPRATTQPVAPVVQQPRGFVQRVMPQALPNAPQVQQAAPIEQPQRGWQRGDGEGRGRHGGWHR